MEATYSTRPLSAETWDDFAALVEANNGVWGGCWCMGFHPDGFDERGAEGNRENKRAHVRRGTVHQLLVYDGADCVSWCQYGSPAELPNIKNVKAYDKELDRLPDWRIGCIFTGKGHRRQGVARTARPGEPVRGVRVRARSQDRQVALGDASARPLICCVHDLPGS